MHDNTLRRTLPQFSWHCTQAVVMPILHLNYQYFMSLDINKSVSLLLLVTQQIYCPNFVNQRKTLANCTKLIYVNLRVCAP
jgi:hypothetical protein